jgi:Zn-dependent protease/CBS domain-containing protein
MMNYLSSGEGEGCLMNIGIGKILGIPIRIDVSWLVIFALIVYSLAVGYFPKMSPNISPAMSWLGGVIAALLLFASVLLHEVMHSYVAKRNGLPVGGITLFIFGGVSQLMEEPQTPEIELKMALAGPATSLLIGCVLFFALIYIRMILPGSLVTDIIYYLAWINIVLGIFNLVPGFPLDGGRVLRAILWGSLANLDRATRIASDIGQGFGYAFVLGGFWMMLSQQFLSGLWLIFIGWFLNNAAQQSYQQVRLKRALSGVGVRLVMSTEYPHVDPEESIDAFVHEYLLRYDYSAFPVSEGDILIGIVGVNEVRTIPREDWNSTAVRKIARSPEQETTIDENDDAFDALMHMAQGRVNRLLVMHEGHLKGIVTQDSIINLVRTKLRLDI